jgi:phosphate transport system substrate-binding protein
MPTMNRILRQMLGGLAGLLIAASAQGEELVVPGSGSLEYVLGELAKAFNAQQGQHHVSVPPSSGTAGALRDVEQGHTPLGRVGRPLKDAERARGLAYLPIGLDAVVFVGGAGVNVRGIGKTQAIDIYSGRVTDWRDLGGKPAPIRAIGREGTDTSRQAIAREVKAFGELQFHESVKQVHLDPQMIELLDRYPASLGFLNRSALSAARTALVPLAFEGIEPSPENLAAGRYPLKLEFGFVHKAGALNDAAKAFVLFVQSPSGERILRDRGVLPLAAVN